MDNAKQSNRCNPYVSKEIYFAVFYKKFSRPDNKLPDSPIGGANIMFLLTFRQIKIKKCHTQSLQFFKYSDKIQNFKLWNLQIFENSLSLLELAIFLQKSTLQFEICKYLKIPSLLEFALFCKKFEFVLIFRIFKSFLNIQTKFIHFKNLQNILI